jgi:hypothetical protein
MASLVYDRVPRKYGRAGIALLVLGVIGLISFAIAAELPEKCQFHQDCLDNGSCSGAPLHTATVSRQCEVAAGNMRFRVPKRGQLIIDEIKRMAHVPAPVYHH